MPAAEQSNTVSIVMFIDALGWEVLRDRGFLEQELTHRRKLRSVLGFSSACVPSILSGLLPRDHRHWSFFYHSPETSPFKALRFLDVLPRSITERGRVRRWISRAVKRFYGFTGYFQLYNMPFRLANRFDYCEKRDLFAAGGITGGPSIFDHLRERDIEFHRSDWRRSEETNLLAANDCLARGDVPFAFVYLADMDGLLHQVGKASDKVDAKLAWYEDKIRDLLATAQVAYDEVRLFICSDHGMCTVNKHIDVMSAVAELGLNEGRDYVATYDSTMARFWYMNDAARVAITEMLATRNDGHILSDSELSELGCDFEGRQYGETIFLVHPGTLILPSHMGTAPITGMHGYHPDHPDSYAVLLSNVEPTPAVKGITDLFGLMRCEAEANAGV